MQTTGRPKTQSGHATARGGEQPTSNLKRRVTTAAVACDHVLHGVGRSVFILAPFIMLALLIAGLGYVRLRHGPISLDFLVEPIERGINAELAGNTVRIDDAIVSLSETGGLEFRLSNIRVHEPDGDVVASAPFAAVELSTSALWSMRVVPARIELIEPRLFLFYSESGGLAMSFSKPVAAAPGTELAAAPEPVAPAPVPAARPAPVTPANEAAGPLKRIDLARVLTDMSSRARQGLDATSYLRELGLRNATVLVDYAGRTTEWRVPALTVGLMHGRTRSVITGRATVAAAGGKPWQLTFETDESERNRTLTLKTSIKNLVPRSISGTVPELSLLQPLDLPVDGEATMELTSDGDVRAATLSIGLGHGSLRLPALPEAPLEVDGGSIKLAYDGVAEKVTLAPSTLSWRGSRVTISGFAAADNPEAEHPAWSYQLRSTDGSFAAEEFKVTPIALEEWTASGRIQPHRGAVELGEFKLRAGGAAIDMTGSLIAGAEPASTRLEGTLSPMTLNTLKALWPKAIAPGAREWIGERVDRASVLGGRFRFASGDQMSTDVSVGTKEHQLSFSLDIGDIEMRVIDKLPPIVAARAITRIENDALEVVIPEAGFVLSPDRLLPLKDGRFTAVDIMSDVPMGEIVFTSQPTLGGVIELIAQAHPAFLEETGLPRDGIDGKVDAKFKLNLPLLADLPDGSVRIDGKGHLADGRIKQIAGYQVQSVSVDFDINEKAAGASGQMLVNGVLAKLNWQRIFDAPLDKQPPLRLTATLDNTDRSQLGLDINHIVQGEVPIELTVENGPDNQSIVRLHGDLTNADLVLEGVAWRKPPGRSATIQCDIAKGKTHKTELQNFKVAGDDIAIEGWIAISADNRMREFFFPDFSLNVVTRMEVQGTLGKDDVWKVRAKGPTLDGRDFFRSLFSLGQLGEKGPSKPKDAGEGIDLDAEIGTVIGHHEVSLRNVKMKLSKRGDKLVALDVRSTLDGGKPLAVVLRQDPGQPRKLFADSTDAGQAFKLIDFYPNIQGGRVRLEVNLEGKGAAEKTGILWVEQFRILGDPVVSEVFSGADEGRPAIDGGTGRRAKHVAREVFDFTLMRVPFSVGYGQFVMSDSQLRGPMLGASIRGKVDYKMRRVNLGGTYVPLQGLNSALCEIPLFGQIITGPKCEGISGMTFAIQGSMDRPEVIVNPLSMLAPGIFRDIFQMTPFDPKVQRRDDDATGTTDEAVRASSTIGKPGDVGEAAAPGTVVGNETIDGWSSQTVSPPTKKR